MSRLAASLVAISLALAPVASLACTLNPITVVGTKQLRTKCRQALASPDRFLDRIKSGKIDRTSLIDFVVAFDEGEYGCNQNKGFVFRMLDSYYSVGDRKLKDPHLLQRYAFNFPAGADPAKRSYVNNLLWLFTENVTYLPTTWTPGDARAFVERPEHWPIALAKFGRMRDRDDAVFASIADPQSSHFDRQLALKLAGYESLHQKQRKLRVAELFADPRFGPPDLALAEKLVPVSGLYGGESDNPAQQRARAVWLKIIDGYSQSADPAINARGQELRAKLAPPVQNGWLKLNPPRDGRVWLSLADWPQTARNPLAGLNIGPNLLTANDYPTRALREEQAGLVTVAARFDQDGKFVAVEAIRSSGSTLLDETATGLVARRLRPKLADITIAGFKGREVVVPLVAVSWEITDEVAEQGHSGFSHYSNGILSVVALSRDSGLYGANSCGYFQSVFL